MSYVNLKMFLRGWNIKPRQRRKSRWSPQDQAALPPLSEHKPDAVVVVKTVNVETVVRYWEAASQYGCSEVTAVCVDWLTVNLLSHLPDHPARLREISPGLMSELVSSAHLFVVQTEFSVYELIRLWMFLQLQPDWVGEPQVAKYCISCAKIFLQNYENIPGRKGRQSEPLQEDAQIQTRVLP